MSNRQMGLTVVCLQSQILCSFCQTEYNGKDLITFNTRFLRDHLIYCLEKQMFIPFPKHQTKEKINRKKPYFLEISLDCSKCRLPNVLEEMVGCDTKHCEVWRHRHCASQPSDEDEDWFCSPHMKRT